MSEPFLIHNRKNNPMPNQDEMAQGHPNPLPKDLGIEPKPMPESQAKAHGYVEQTPETSHAFQMMNLIEEQVLRTLRRAQERGPGFEHVDPRWVSIAITDIEKAFMMARRAVVKRPS